MAPNIDRRPNNYELLEPTLQQLKWLAAQSVEILAAVAPESPTRSEKPRRLRRRFSSEEVKEMAQQYRDGVSTPQLCAEHGISKTGVLRLLHEEGVEVRRQTATDGVVAEAAQLYEAGMPVTRIAEQLSVSGSALRRSMLKAGVDMRPRGGYRRAPLA